MDRRGGLRGGPRAARGGPAGWRAAGRAPAALGGVAARARRAGRGPGRGAGRGGARAIAPTPQSLVSEGIAKLAPWLLLEGDGGAALAAVVRDAGVELDLEQALAVRRALRPCEWAEVNAALLLHERGASEDEARAYLERWELLSPELAGHVVRFLREPTSRTYVLTYPAGEPLCRAWVGGEPERFRRLVGEQVRVGDLLRAAGGSLASAAVPA